MFLRVFQGPAGFSSGGSFLLLTYNYIYGTLQLDDDLSLHQLFHSLEEPCFLT